VLLLKVVSMSWGVDCLCGFPMIYDGLETGSNNFSMNAATSDSKVAKTGMPSGDIKASALTKPTRLTK